MEILWEYGLPTDENSRDHQYESPIFVKDNCVLFVCRNSEDRRKYSLYIIDKTTGALKEEVKLGGHTVIPEKCFFETVGKKTVIYTGSLWTYTNEEGLRELCENLFECENAPVPEELSAYDLALFFEERQGYEITSHLVYGNCFIFSNKYGLYCIDVEENTLKWKINAPNSTSLSCGCIKLFEDKLSFYGNDKLLFADISSGDIVDEIKISRISKLFSPVRMSDGTILMGYTNWSGAGILRYDTKCKKVIWKSKRSFEGPLPRCSVFLWNGLAYWIKNDTELICINKESGEEAYSVPTRPWLYAEPFFMNGRIIFGTSGANGFLTNIDAEKGNVIWSLPLKNGCAYFAVYEGNVIAGDFDKKLYSIDFASGEILQEISVGGEVVGSLTAEDGFAYTVVWGNETKPIKLIKVKIS